MQEDGSVRTCQTHFFFLTAEGKCHPNKPGELNGSRCTVKFLYGPLYAQRFDQTKRGTGFSL